MIARQARTVLASLGIGACALACAAPGLVAVALSGVSTVALGAPMTIAAVGILGLSAVVLARRRPAHACPDGACTCG